MRPSSQFVSSPRLLAFAAASCLGLACSRRAQTDPTLRQQSALLIQTVDALRHAANRDKPAHLHKLLAVPCSDGETCAFKDRCIDAYSSFLQALDAVAKAEASLGAEPTRAAEILASAQLSLDESKQKTLACAAAQGELARRHDL